MKHLKIYILVVSNETLVFLLSSNFRVVRTWCLWSTERVPDLALNLTPLIPHLGQSLLQQDLSAKSSKNQRQLSLPENKGQLSLVLETLIIITEF